MNSILTEDDEEGREAGKKEIIDTWVRQMDQAIESWPKVRG